MVTTREPSEGDVEVHYLRSDHAGDKFKIFIGRCDPAPASPEVVLFVTDAILLFGAAVEIGRLFRFEEWLPPAGGCVRSGP